MQEFADMFLEEISGKPSPCEIEFYIDLIPGSTPISRAPHRIVLAKLKELKSQLDELLEKGYLRACVIIGVLGTLREEQGWNPKVMH